MMKRSPLSWMIFPLLILPAAVWTKNAAANDFRQQAIDQADQEIKNRGMSPVAVNASEQPGYVADRPSGASNAFANTWDNYSTYELQETRAQLGLGVADVRSSDRGILEPAFAVRYRLSPVVWPVPDDQPW